ncbi:MAG: hypothetical protein HW407_335 [Bacteroidetes bacterium]|nr:hypothetical protein [Bacteroidota bacterium]
MRSTFSWFGTGLIIVGLVTLLDRLDVLYLDWTTAVWGLIAVFGAARMIDGFQQKLRARLFWGVFLLLLGTFNVLLDLDVVSFRYHMFPPVVLLILGASILALFVLNPKEWHLLIPAISFLGLGVLWILVSFGYVYRYEVVDAVRFYWPIALILFGLSLLLRRKST